MQAVKSMFYTVVPLTIILIGLPILLFVNIYKEMKMREGSENSLPGSL
jgi:hypothetical protein